MRDVEEWLGVLNLSPLLEFFSATQDFTAHLFGTCEACFFLIPVCSSLIELSLKVNASSLMYSHGDNSGPSAARWVT